MIKIIKEGTRKETQCPECGCLFSYEREDVCDYTYIGGVSNGLKQFHIECPQCKNDIILKEVNINEI